MDTKLWVFCISSSLVCVYLELHLILFLLLNLSPPLIKTNKMHEKMYLFDVFALPPRRSTRGHGRISPTQLPPPAWLRLVQERRGRWTQAPPPPLRLIQPKKLRYWLHCLDKSYIIVVSSWGDEIIPCTPTWSSSSFSMKRRSPARAEDCLLPVEKRCKTTTCFCSWWKQIRFTRSCIHLMFARYYFFWRWFFWLRNHVSFLFFIFCIDQLFTKR